MDVAREPGRESPLALLRALASRSRGLARRVVDQALQPIRRRAALRTVARLAPVRRYLVLCHGNICRSPYAAIRLAGNGGGSAPQVHQGGFLGPGRPAPDIAVRTAARLGVDLSAHRSRLVTYQDVGDVELIVVMDAGQGRQLRRRFTSIPTPVVLLGDFDPEPAQSRDIPDPYGLDEAVFEATYLRIDRCLARLRQVGDGGRGDQSGWSADR